eukprot:3716772-Prorocentrum_lima.AAC.1
MEGPLKEKLPSFWENGTTKAHLISEGVNLDGFISTTSQFERLRQRSYDDAKLLNTCGKRLQKTLTDLTTK